MVDVPADGVATLTLNRPEKRNALSIAVRDEVSDALDALAADESLKAVVITGAGDVFCSGFDLKEFERLGEPEFADRLWASSDRFHRTVLEFPLPTVAAVNGPALAGGFDLAVMCDVRVAADTARFAHPELSFGDVPVSVFLASGGSVPLPVEIFQTLQFDFDPRVLAISTIVVVVSSGFIVVLLRCRIVRF